MFRGMKWEQRDFSSDLCNPILVFYQVFPPGGQKHPISLKVFNTKICNLNDTMFYIDPQTACEIKVILNLLKKFLHPNWLVALGFMVKWYNWARMVFSMCVGQSESLRHQSEHYKLPLVPCSTCCELRGSGSARWWWDGWRRTGALHPCVHQGPVPSGTGRMWHRWGWTCSMTFSQLNQHMQHLLPVLWGWSFPPGIYLIPFEKIYTLGRSTLLG